MNNFEIFPKKMFQTITFNTTTFINFNQYFKNQINYRTNQTINS